MMLKRLWEYNNENTSYHSRFLVAIMLKSFLRDLKNNNYIYKPLSKDNITDCLLVCDSWCKRKNCSDCEYTCEKNIIKEIVDNFEYYPVDGGVIYIDNNIRKRLLHFPVLLPLFFIHFRNKTFLKHYKLL